jgi:hypothetical protein
MTTAGPLMPCYLVADWESNETNKSLCRNLTLSFKYLFLDQRGSGIGTSKPRDNCWNLGVFEPKITAGKTSHGALVLRSYFLIKSTTDFRLRVMLTTGAVLVGAYAVCGRFFGLVHTFWFSTGQRVQIIAGQSSRTQESVRLFTQPGCWAGSWFNSSANVAYRQVHTLRLLPVCIRAFTIVSIVLKQ